LSGLPATARIGFDAVRALRNATGLGNYARQLLRGLHEAAPHLAVHLYAPRPARPAFAALPAELGATLHLPPSAWQSIGLRALWRTTRLGRFAAQDGVALYHGLTHEIPRDLPATGIPSVVTIHDLLFHTHPELFSAIDRRSYAWRYRWSIDHATALLAVSTHTRDELQQLLGVPAARIAVIPPARDPRFAVPVSDATRSAVRARHGLPSEYLIAVGTLEPRKNQQLAVRALPALPLDAPPLVLVGRDGGSETTLRTEARALGVEGRVRFLAEVTDDELPALLQGAAVALYLSRAEGFGMPVVEAMSAGVPVVIAAGPHLRDAGGSAAVVVPPDDPAAVAAAIVGLLESTDRRRAAIDAGTRHAEGFGAATLARRLLSVYDAVVSGGSLPDQPDPHPPTATPTPPLETSL
jgi:glycosyltransferase involved in cell wall biosynthesis